MGVSTRTDDPTLALRAAAGDACEDVVRGEGIEKASTRVWYKQLPGQRSDIDPYVILNVRQTKSTLAGTKDTEPVNVILTVQCHGTDELEVFRLKKALLQDLTDRTDPLPLTGWQIIWHDLISSNPLDVTDDGEPTLFGHVLELVYHIEAQ